MYSMLFLVSTAIAAVTGRRRCLETMVGQHPARATCRSLTSRRSRPGNTSTPWSRAAPWTAATVVRPWAAGSCREGAILQTWESNRSVRMENVGQTDVVNPWLSNGRNNFRNAQEIVSSAVTPDMTGAEKAFAFWFQEIRYRHHSPGDNNELGDPVKVFNVYGHNTCGNDSVCMATLWRTAGLKVAPARALGHCISQTYYDNAWHFYDGDMHSVYLLRDNETVAGEQDIVRDHDLVKRTHYKGILSPDTWWDGPEFCSMYFYEGAVAGDRGRNTDTR